MVCHVFRVTNLYNENIDRVTVNLVIANTYEPPFFSQLNDKKVVPRHF